MANRHRNRHMSRVILLASSNQNKKTATTKIYINRQCKHWQSLVYLVFGVYLFSVEWILYVFRNRNRWYNQMSHLNASRNRIFTTIYYCKHNLWIFHWNVFNKWIAFFLGVCALCKACATKVQTNKKTIRFFCWWNFFLAQSTCYLFWFAFFTFNSIL